MTFEQGIWLLPISAGLTGLDGGGSGLAAQGPSRHSANRPALAAGDNDDAGMDRGAAADGRADARVESAGDHAGKREGKGEEMNVSIVTTPYQLAHPRLVNRGEGILLDDLQFLIRRDERAGIVAAHAQAGLGEVVRAEAEELSLTRDLVGGERAAGYFDHRADVRE